MNFAKSFVFLGLTVFVSSGALGNDTPFLRYRCQYGSPIENREFDIQFRNDDSHEAEHFSTLMKKSRLTFKKKDRKSVEVRIVTGMVLVSYAAPEEYRFTAPLTTPTFDFSMSIRDGALVSLECVKE
jgi:hypothetical protein